MPNSSENDAARGWVAGDLPGEQPHPAADAERQPAPPVEDEQLTTANAQPAPDETDALETEPAADEDVPEASEGVTELAVADADPIVQAELQDCASDVSALLGATFEAAPDEPAGQPEPAPAAPATEVPPLFLGEVVLPAEPAAPEDLDTPENVVVAVEAELQAEDLATDAAAEVPPPPAEDAVPVTSEAEAAVDEITPPEAVLAEPANGVERPVEAGADEKPRKRGKKAREPKPAVVPAEAAEALAQASRGNNGPAVTLGAVAAAGDMSLVALVESLLFVADGAVPIARLAEALEIQPREVEAALAELAESYQHRGLSVQRFRDRVQLTTAPAAAAMVERFLGLAASTPLSRAALEALAIVAYQQPVTRPQIEAVRGVNSDSVIKNLLTKGLIEESGRAEGPGRPVLYSTTTEFMQHFGLTALTDLPPLTPPGADPTPETNMTEHILKG